MKILSWNVNGIRAAAAKGLLDWWQQEDADIVCLQEVKVFPEQLGFDLRYPAGYQATWHAGQRPGYAGTATFSKAVPKRQVTNFGSLTNFHQHGRVVEVAFDQFTLLNIYFPNGNPNAKGEERLSYKLQFYADCLHYLNALRQRGESLVICGDFNVAHQAIDLARPQENKDSIGFLPVERAWLDEFTRHGYVDVFRHFNPALADVYSWWSYRSGARKRNVGWRLDYFFVSTNLIEKVKNITHQTAIMGSDHCPLALELEL